MAAINPFYTQLLGATLPVVPTRPGGIGAARSKGKDIAPIYLQPMDPRQYINFFDTYLSVPAPPPAPGQAQAAPLTVRDRVARALGWVAGGPANQQPNLARSQTDTALTMNSESDVVRAAQLYLIAPVETLIRRMYGLDDANNPPVNGVTRFWSTAEETRGGNRTDLAWYVTTVQNGVTTTRCVLILEFKQRGLLKFDDWILGLGCPILPQNWAGLAVNQNMMDYPSKSDAILPEVAMQGIRYQTSIDFDAPRRVVLFDYQSMCVLQFPGTAPNEYKGVLGLVWQSETNSVYQGLVNTGVFTTLQQQDDDTTLYNTIGTRVRKDIANLTTISLTKNRQDVLTAAGQPPRDGTFAEMLLVCLLDGIMNP